MRNWNRLSVAVLLVLALETSVLAPRLTDAVGLWTDPVVLFSTETGFVSDPVLLADQEHVVHLFFTYSETANGDRTGGLGAGGLAKSPGMLMYAHLQNGRWSIPTDVLTSSDDSGVAQPAATVDSHGYLHVVWKRPVEGDLEYSRAHVSQALAGRPLWTRPVPLSDTSLAAGSFGTPASITSAADASLHLVYAAANGGIRYRRSDDHGHSWTNSVTITDQTEATSMPDLPQITADDPGRLHVTWTEFRLPTGWPPVSTFATYSDDRGQTWADGIRLTGENYGLIRMAAVGSQVVHRVWNSTAAIGERRHQWSADGGMRWTPSARIFPPLGGGFTGFPALAADSAGRLHLATSVAAPPGFPTTEIVYHLQWDASGWSAPTFISKGAVGRRSVEKPTLAITEGNRIHTAWEDDFQRIWYTTRLADAPTIPARSLPPPQEAAPLMASPVASPLAPPAQTDLLPSALHVAALESRSDPGMPLVAGAASTLLLLALAIRLVTHRA